VHVPDSQKQLVDSSTSKCDKKTKTQQIHDTLFLLEEEDDDDSQALHESQVIYTISFILPSTHTPLSMSLRRSHNLTTNNSRLLIRKILNIAHDSLGSLGRRSLAKAIFGLPFQDGLHTVLGVGTEFNDGPGFQTERGPGFLDQGHVVGEVVGHVEVCAFGVEDLRSKGFSGWRWEEVFVVRLEAVREAYRGA
jgi:hypothetical protein